jgi:murein DD-endopeptidase MepM/ murein hydrolase activator NlpD
MTLEDRRLPVDGGRIHVPPDTRAWGAVRPGHTHAGVDIGGRDGTAVLAPEAGQVLDVGRLPARPPWTGYAPAVVMLGRSGRWHLLAHLSGGTGPLVVPGQAVELGQTLGYIGRERHVHWEVRTRPHARRAVGEDTYSITIDPGAWLEGADVPFPRGAEGLDPSRPAQLRRRTAEVMGLASVSR